MNNVIMRKIDLTSEYQPRAVEKTVGTVTISTPPSNTGDVLFLGDTNQEVPWVPGEWHYFKSVDLSSIQVKGSVGDIVTIVGGTW